MTVEQHFSEGFSGALKEHKILSTLQKNWHVQHIEAETKTWKNP
jgi:hypothetical protein